jgi:ABC-2 type transport system ATP-binding protein
MYVQVEADGRDVAGRAPTAHRRHTRSSKRTGATGSVGFEVESEQGHDIRRDLARTIVMGGWGLMELRPMRMSLEEIFLSLTTEETESPVPTGESANA